MLLNELGNFKYIMLFMLIPISNLWMNGFVAGAVWIGILVYVVPPVLAYVLDRYEVGQPNQMHSGRHRYQKGNRTPRLNHKALLGGALIANQLHQHLSDNPIAGVELSDNSNAFTQWAADWDAWESENSRFANDILSHKTDTTDDWNHFHASDYDSSPFSHYDIFDNHGINPANGLPMMDSSTDIHGNMFGTNSVDDTFTSTWGSIFDHHSSFDSTGGFMHHDAFSSSCIESSYDTFGDNRY